MTENRESWGSHLGFVLAAAGSAVGLGNIWRFPYVAGENGGGLFIAIYILCVIVLGLPVMLAEMAIGRATQRSPVGAFKALKPGTPWWAVGGMGVLCGFVILSFYSVVAGWTLGYVIESLRGVLSGATPEEIKAHFEAFIANPAAAVGYLVLMMALTIFIVARGVKGGIERYSKILMPALFVMLLLVIFRSLSLEGSAAGLEFLFWPDIDALKPRVLLDAMGQAFFSMSLGMGAMLTYGSYLSRKENMPKSALSVGGLDLLVAILGGMALFPAVFAFGMKPDQGTGLVFVTLPVIFDQIPFGQVFMILFFVLLVVAALTSTISLLEVISSYLIDEHGWTRTKAVLVMGAATIIVGIPSALSPGLLNPAVIGFNFMGLAEKIAANYMLPIGALLLSIFAGFVWSKSAVLEEVRAGSGGFALADVWLFVVRWLAPFIIAQIIIIGFLGEFSALEGTVEQLASVISVVDAIVVGLLVIGTVVYFVRRRARPFKPPLPLR